MYNLSTCPQQSRCSLEGCSAHTVAPLLSMPVPVAVTVTEAPRHLRTTGTTRHCEAFNRIIMSRKDPLTMARHTSALCWAARFSLLFFLSMRGTGLSTGIVANGRRSAPPPSRCGILSLLVLFMQCWR